MNLPHFRSLVGTLVLFGANLAQAQHKPATHPMFDGDVVHPIHLHFSQADWYDQLRANFEGVEDPTYLEAAFDWQELHYESIGVRFKGNSSYNSYPGNKKSFKLNFDEYVTGQTVYGMDKLNLNNAFKDPSFVREKCYYELAAEAGLSASRVNHAALYINDEYWGLYSAVEQVDFADANWLVRRRKSARC